MSGPSSSGRIGSPRGRAVAEPDRDARPDPATDRDALEALAWIESGMPDAAVGYGPDAPRLTREQLDEFREASYAAPTGVPTRVKRRAVRE